jgi:tetratricopeptide (TPR) repeat protein
MNAKVAVIVLVAILGAFYGGFYLANSLNGAEFARLQAENEQLRKNKGAAPADQELSADEIRARIKEADDNPTNINFQKNLGLALLSYGVSKQDVALIREVTRLLARAHDATPSDFDVVVGLGNAYYDIASLDRTDAGFITARDFYEKALVIKPDAAGVRADLGSTYVFVTTPDFTRANTELTKALATEPKNPRILQLMTQAMIKQGRMEEAEKFGGELKALNPNAPGVTELANEMKRDEAARSAK